ncbi:Uncharacterized protein HZ326_27175 [Fusarium oxysporum f. sp. albedinis]|nr:Uncharacterized protein HZ326_27175 [Fusarium oxysporum f. sp. albedinis]
MDPAIRSHTRLHDESRKMNAVENALNCGGASAGSAPFVVPSHPRQLEAAKTTYTPANTYCIPLYALSVALKTSLAILDHSNPRHYHAERVGIRTGTAVRSSSIIATARNYRLHYGLVYVNYVDKGLRTHRSRSISLISLSARSKRPYAARHNVEPIIYPCRDRARHASLQKSNGIRFMILLQPIHI